MTLLSPPAAKRSRQKPVKKPSSVTKNYSSTDVKLLSFSSIRIITGCFQTMPMKQWIPVISDLFPVTIS